MLVIPLSIDRDPRLEGDVGPVPEPIPDVAVPRGQVGGADRVALRVPVGHLGERIERRPEEARVQRSRREFPLAEQLLLERAIFDSKIRLQQVWHGEPGKG